MAKNTIKKGADITVKRVVGQGGCVGYDIMVLLEDMETPDKCLSTVLTDGKYGSLTEYVNFENTTQWTDELAFEIAASVCPELHKRENKTLPWVWATGLLENPTRVTHTISDHNYF